MNARELAAMKARLWAGLTPTEIRGINWAAVADAAAVALDRGWTGEQVGSAGLENLTGARSVGAIIVANIRALAQTAPPTTPTPPPVAVVLAAPGHRPTARPTQWANEIRGALQ